MFKDNNAKITGNKRSRGLWGKKTLLGTIYIFKKKMYMWK